jgi:outer membrane protein OmpA-like peptidoglycan-associated protein
MNKPGLHFTCIGIIIPAVLAVATSGCATKKYVRQQIAPVDTKVSALEVKTNDQADKESTDISRVEEKLGSTDAKVAEVASAAQKANATADRANQLAEQDQSATQANQAAIAVNAASIATLDQAMNYSLVTKADVTFSFNKSKLDKTDEAALDALVQQVQSTPRVEFELLGFTDPVGTTEYNLALSRRRAESVARYLVRRGIPLRGIHIVGLGKEPVPAGVLADVQAVDPNVTKAEAIRLARRVLIRIYAPNAGTQISSVQ